MTAATGSPVELRSCPTTVGGAFTPAEYARRYDLVARLMGDQGLSAIVFHGSGGGGDIHYLTNWIPSREAYLVWPQASDPVLFVQLFNHVPQAQALAVIPDVRFGGSNARGAVDTSAELVAALRDRKLDGARIGLAGSMPYKTFLRLREELGGAEFVDVSGAVRDARSVRSEEEFGRIARAARLGDRAIEALTETLRPGLTELDLARIVDEAQGQDGGYTTLRHMCSTPMAAPSACVPAKYLTDRRLEKGDVVVVELSAGWGGYSGQVLRTFTVGEPPSALFALLHEVAEAAYEAARATIRDGASIEDVLDAVDLIDEAGLTICDDLLHGANQFPPILRTRQSSHGIPTGMTFREDMAVVLQPNVITPDRSAGVQYGQMLRVRRDGVEDLHHAPGGLIVTGAG